MPQAEGMTQSSSTANRWAQRRIGITGARGRLGQALAKQLRSRGAIVVGLTHGSIPASTCCTDEPQQWVRWQCGAEQALDDTLRGLDILVLNHGINPHGGQSPEALNAALEVNALSSWRLMERFEAVVSDRNSLAGHRSDGIGPDRNSSALPCELWINTSEAEIQPALSPAYEISKRLIGQLVSLRWCNRSLEQRSALRIRKLVLGPFRSELNPIGVMSADLVADQVIKQVELGLSLIIVTPNPLTYVLMPLTELARWIYGRLLRQNP